MTAMLSGTQARHRHRADLDDAATRRIGRSIQRSRSTRAAVIRAGRRLSAALAHHEVHDTSGIAVILAP